MALGRNAHRLLLLRLNQQPVPERRHLQHSSRACRASCRLVRGARCSKVGARNTARPSPLPCCPAPLRTLATSKDVSAVSTACVWTDAARLRCCSPAEKSGRGACDSRSLLYDGSPAAPVSSHAASFTVCRAGISPQPKSQEAASSRATSNAPSGKACTRMREAG